MSWANKKVSFVVKERFHVLGHKKNKVFYLKYGNWIWIHFCKTFVSKSLIVLTSKPVNFLWKLFINESDLRFIWAAKWMHPIIKQNATLVALPKITVAAKFNGRNLVTTMKPGILKQTIGDTISPGNRKLLWIALHIPKSNCTGRYNCNHLWLRLDDYSETKFWSKDVKQAYTQNVGISIFNTI